MTTSEVPAPTAETMADGSIKTRLLAAFAIVLAIVGFMAWASVRNTREFNINSDWVNHTHAVILEVDAVLSSLHAAEAAQRDFLITRLGRDEAAARRAFGEVREHLQVTEALVINDTRRQETLRSLKELVERRLKLNDTVLEQSKVKGLEGAKEVLASEQGPEVLDKIARTVSKMKQDENVLLQDRDQKTLQSTRRTHRILYTGVVVNCLLLAMMFWLIHMDLAVRRKAANIMREANERLEVKVKERTEDLAQANASLEVENLEQRWAKAAMERMCRQNELIFNSIHEAVFVISSQGNIIQLNAAAAAMVGSQTKNLMGKPLRQVFRDGKPGAEAPAWAQDPLNLAVKEDKPIQGGIGWVRRVDGNQTAVSFGLTPVRDSEKIVGAVLTAGTIGSNS